MIYLSNHRRANLEMMFQGVPDRDLIHELLRRKRFRQMESSARLCGQLRNEPNYMAHINDRLAYSLAKGLMADKEYKPVLTSETKSPNREPFLSACDGEGPRETLYTADVVVLVARKKEEN